MRWLTLAHSRRRQALHGQPGLGTLYQGRYRSHFVDSDDQLLTVVRYIERNPVRAGLAEHAVDWPWSSVRERMGGCGALLAPLQVAVPSDWASRLDSPETATEVALWHKKRGRPAASGRQLPNGR
jgi:putative transposase